MREGQLKGKELEDFTRTFLQKCCGGGRQIMDMRTPNNRAAAHNGGDGGRDFEVTVPAKGTWNLFGIPLLAKRRYFVEVKYVGNRDLDYDAISANLSRIQNEKVESIFIVTNAYLSPSAQFDVCNDFPLLTNKIHIIDGVAFRHWANELGLIWPKGIGVRTPERERTINELKVQTHNVQTRLSGEAAQFFYMTFRNWTKEEQAVEVVTLADVSWHFTDRADLRPNNPVRRTAMSTDGNYCKTLVIKPWHSKTLRLCGIFLKADPTDRVILRESRGPKEDGARIAVLTDEKSTLLFPNVLPIKVSFKPAFTGQYNKKLCKSLIPIFEKVRSQETPALLQVIHIDGDAGLGKSRLVDEILPIQKHSEFVVLHHTVEYDNFELKVEDSHWTAIRSQLRPRVNKYDDLAWLDRIIDPISLIDAILGPLQETTLYGKWAALILVIEDLHNGSEGLCHRIKSAIESNKNLGTNVILIITGRSDDTYINPDYRELSGALRNNMIDCGKSVAPVICHRLSPLTGQEAAAMVAKLIEGIQPDGIKRLLALSGPIPHNIVQCTEYLLDNSLVAITGANTLSIVDQMGFEIRSHSLPKTMNKLFSERFENLASLSGANGSAAQEAILAATVLGTRFSKMVCSMLSGIDGDAICSELIDRRFFKASKSDNGKENQENGYLEWHHENLLLFFREHQRAKAQHDIESPLPLGGIAGRFAGTAQLIRNSTAIWDELPAMMQGDVAITMGDRVTAANRFAPLLMDVANINTFNTLDAPISYFDHIPYAVSYLRHDTRVDRHELIWKLLVLKVYIGTHNKSLGFEIEAFTYGMKMLPLLNLPEYMAKRCKIWMQTIDAEAYLGSGRAGAALDRLMRLIHVARDLEMSRMITASTDSTDWDILFDIHNSLQLLFLTTNFKELAQANAEMATHCVKQSSIKALEDVNLGDWAFFYMHVDRKKSIALLEEARDLNKKQGSQRHGWIAEVSLIASHLPDHFNKKVWLRNSATAVDKIIGICETSYHNIMPQTHLLRAVIEYAIGCAAQNDGAREDHFEEAFVIANRGLNACEAASIGSISWQIRNLQAVIYARRGNWNECLIHLSTAIALIEHEGLTFMGRDGIISAAPIVMANYVKVAASRKSERHMLQFLQKLHGFEPYNWGTLRHLDDAKHLAKQYHHIVLGCGYAPDGLMIDSKTNLAVVLWFG
jgi:hypothetical protein